MRPPGECHLALIRAAHALRLERAQSGQGATLLELVQRSQVGYQVARTLVANMRRSGTLQIVRTRKVPYRNKPVSEYVLMQALAPATATEPTHDTSANAAANTAVLCELMASWSR